MSVFNGDNYTDYPAYLVQFRIGESSPNFSPDEIYAFYVVNAAGPGYPGALGSDNSANTALIAAIASYIEANGWGGGAISDLTVTKYTEASSDVTP